jgi:hypothetical protein
MISSFIYLFFIFYFCFDWQHHGLHEQAIGSWYQVKPRGLVGEKSIIIAISLSLSLSLSLYIYIYRHFTESSSTPILFT